MDPDFKKRLLETYRTEAGEHLEAVGKRLLALEEDLDQAERERLLKEIFRQFHSLKGAARAVNETVVEALCHRCEDLLAGISKEDAGASANLADRLREVHSLLRRWHQAQPDERPPVSEEELARVMDLLAAGQKKPSAAPGKSARASAAKPAEAPAPRAGGPRLQGARPHGGGTVRTPVERLDAILYRAEEILGVRDEAGRGLGKLLALRDRFTEWRREWGKIQPEASMLRFLGSEAPAPEQDLAFRQAIYRIYGFIDWNRDFFEEIRRTVRELAKEGLARQGVFELSVDRLLDETKEVLMVPFSHELEGLAVLVSESARQAPAPKKVRLRVEGGDVEVDRRILEAIKNPLIHLLRNAVDHSIEEPAERERAGKPAEGSIHFSATPLGDGTVEVVVADDGRGIAREDLRRKLVAAGLIEQKEAEAAPVSRMLDLIFEPEFSTRTSVSGSSGRGLGLAIVRERVEGLGGHVFVSSEEGKGTVFRMVLPLSLARFRAVEVFAGSRRFLLPSTKISRAGRLRRREIRPVKGQDTIQHASVTLPLFHLASLLGLPGESGGEQVKFITIDAPRAAFALAVDEIGDEREVVMKGLGPQLRRVRHVAGASIGESGDVVPILDLADLAKTVAGGGAIGPVKLRQEAQALARSPKVLVVEDSITARSLLKNILEESGYQVVTARDGVEGMNAAQTEPFDLVLTDVEMPRLDGIELTRQLRGEEKLRGIPIVILTARASREDKEQGMEAGADAYVVKSSFDQSDLLETMRELLGND